ncbi:MAG: hypothetical protein IPG63_05335 [Xanthomonadales bacterium]|jgi:hypothetical protein|nr:hypothetical protein [Xanthomonadales bacterium]MCC6561861.1 hypothetical protein [Xanthomonadales bacterium]
MIQGALLGLIALLSIHAVGNWRSGLLSIVLISALQDPVRKLTPGTPGWLVLASTPVLAALIFGSRFSIRGWFSEFRRTFPRVSQSLKLLALMAVPAALISATYGPGSWMLTVFGVFSYGVILSAVVVGFHFPRGPADVHRLLSAYCVVHGIAIGGGVLEYLAWFPQWTLLGDEALGFNWVRHEWGYVVEIICGFYRSGDVLGWHASAVAMLSLVLALASTGARRWSWLALSGWAVVALLLCGRRKMVYMMPLFGAVLIWVFWQAGRAARAWSLAGLLLLPMASVWLVRDWMGDESPQMRYYTETGHLTLGTVRNQGFNSLLETFEQTGFLGAGLGTAAPGSHQIPAARPRIWQESGPSRVLVELGVPGATAFVALLISIASAMWRATNRQLRQNTRGGLYAAGLLAFFAANIGSLTVSGQILADPFISAFLGIQIGMVLAFARPALAPQGGVATRTPTRPWLVYSATESSSAHESRKARPARRRDDQDFVAPSADAEPSPQLDLFPDQAASGVSQLVPHEVDFPLESPPPPEHDPAVQPDLGPERSNATDGDPHAWH